MAHTSIFRKIGALLLSIALILSLLTACGGTPTDQSGASSGGNSSASASTAGDSSSGGTSKDEVIIATPSEPTVFFCQDGNYSSSMAKDSPVIYNIYSYLAWMDESGEIVPWLATSWEKSEDGTEYLFHLRDDVYFHNGEKMTAEDVAFTYNLCMEKNQPLTTNLLINLQSAEVVDEYTVKFTLTDPFDGFPSETTSRVGGIICKSYYEEVGSEGYMEKPIGTGPYMFDSRVSGQEIVLKAFPDYFLGEAAIKTIRIRPMANTSTSFISLKSGDVDVVNLADVASCQQLTDADIATYLTNPSTARTMMYLNCRPSCNSILKDDLNLRRAIQYCINKDDIVLGAVSGAGQPIDMCAPYFFNGAPDEGSFLTIETDVEAAKEYLAQSNYNGQSLKILVNAGTPEERAAQIVQGQLLAIGINAEIAAVDSGTSTAANQAGEFDLFISTTTGSLNDVSTLNSFYCVQDTMGPWYENWEELENICLEANVASGQDRKDLMAELANIVNENAYDVPLMVKDACITFNKDLQGVSLNTNGTWRVYDWSWK